MKSINPLKLKELKMLLAAINEPYCGISTNLAFRILIEALLDIVSNEENEKLRGLNE